MEHVAKQPTTPLCVMLVSEFVVHHFGARAGFRIVKGLPKVSCELGIMRVVLK